MRLVSMFSAVMVVEILFLLVLLGWGSLVARLLKAPEPHARDPFWAMWLGAVILVLITQCANFLWPIRWWISLPLMGAGLILAARSPYRLEGICRRPAAAAVTVCLALLLVAWASLMPPWNYDSGLYHLNTVRMINELPVVPGMANFHDRYGFNNASLLLPSLLTVFPLVPFGWACHIPTFGLIVLLELICRAAGVAVPGSRLARVVSLLLIAPVCWFILGLYISAPAPDLFCFLVLIPFFLRFVDLLDPSPTPVSRLSCTQYLALLGPFIIVGKLSMGVFVAAVLGLAFVFRAKEFFATRLRGLWLPAALTCVLICSWLARGYLLSGFPVYPVPVGRMELPWSLDMETAELHSKYIAAGNRSTQHWSKVLGNWEWVDSWWRRLMQYPFFTVPAGLAGAGIVLLIFALTVRRNQGAHSIRWQAMVPVIPCLAAIGFWFIAAPDPRLLGSIMWMLAATGWAALMVTFHSRRMLITAAILFVIPLAPRLRDAFFEYTSIPIGEIAQAPGPPLGIQRTADGFPVWVPLDGEQSWDAEMVVTPVLEEGVHLIGQRLEDGVARSRAPR